MRKDLRRTDNRPVLRREMYECKKLVSPAACHFLRIGWRLWSLEVMRSQTMCWTGMQSLALNRPGYSITQQSTSAMGDWAVSARNPRTARPAGNRSPPLGSSASVARFGGRDVMWFNRFWNYASIVGIPQRVTVWSESSDRYSRLTHDWIVRVLTSLISQSHIKI